jgi:murein L,D-transpeptidase YcbB/YkuD
MVVSTSYLKSPKNLNDAGIEYLTPASIDSLRKTLQHYSVCEPVVQNEEIIVFEAVQVFYRLNEYKPVWTHDGGISKRANRLLELIERARDFGLEPAHYHLPVLQELRQEIIRPGSKESGAMQRARLELLMTDAALSLMTNLHAGYTAYDSILFAQDWFSDLPSILYHGVRSGDIRESILSVQPGFLEYTRLQKATEKYLQSNVLTDRWTSISFPEEDSALLMKQIREVLAALGYMQKHNIAGDITQSLKLFQLHHGLEPDGKPGANTIEALGQSTLDRYRILALNLDRLRKQENSDSDLLYVNIPAYRLKVYNNNRLVDTFRVIVGHPSSPTPLLTGTMKTIIANPVWYVPRKIAMNEILPRIKSDSGYLKRNGFRMLDENFDPVNESSINLNDLSADNFTYTIRQNRGSENSLGQVKFIFTNPYTIYLHDTPGKTLFSKDIRAFSHGCVRIENPERLAGYIIREINSDTADMGDLIRSGRHYEINISGTLPIHIRYITCEADGTGSLYFYKDIYGLDKQEMESFAPLMGI